MLRARGRETDLQRVERPPRTFESPAALETFVRRQLFIAPDGAKDRSFKDALRDRIVERDGGWTLADPPAGSIGIVSWEPGPPRIARPPEVRGARRCARRANRRDPGVVSSPDITRPDRRTSRPSLIRRPSAPAGKRMSSARSS